MSIKKNTSVQNQKGNLDSQTTTDRRKFIQGAGLSAVVAAAGSLISSNAAAKTQNTKPRAAQPNIVFILTDNLGYGEVGCYGGGITRGAATPRIDSLAKEGTKLLNANMETQCTPSRSSLMTGRWAIRSGTHSVPFGGVADGLTQWEITIGQALSDAG